MQKRIKILNKNKREVDKNPTFDQAVEQWARLVIEHINNKKEIKNGK